MTDRELNTIEMNADDENVSSTSRGDILAFDGVMRTIGYGLTDFTTSNTRYVAVSPTGLKELAELADEAMGSTVYVGVTPGKPLIMKASRETELALQLAPQKTNDD